MTIKFEFLFGSRTVARQSYITLFSNFTLWFYQDLDVITQISIYSILFSVREETRTFQDEFIDFKGYCLIPMYHSYLLTYIFLQLVNVSHRIANL